MEQIVSVQSIAATSTQLIKDNVYLQRIVCHGDHFQPTEDGVYLQPFDQDTNYKPPIYHGNLQTTAENKSDHIQNTYDNKNIIVSYMS